MKRYQQEFITNLKKYRRQEKLSQARLSELCEVSTGTIGNIECGSSKPSFDLILTIAEVLNISPALLFSEEEAKTESETHSDRELLLDLYAKLKSHLNP